MKKKTTVVMLLIITSALLMASCSSFPIQAEPTAVPESIEDFVPMVSATGMVVPDQSSTLSVATAGIVDEVLVEDGDTVVSDQILLQLKGKEDI